MREIKFRIRSISYNKWIYFKITDLSAIQEVFEADIDWKTLCEFTGLKDIDDCEIYERDIIGVDGFIFINQGESRITKHEIIWNQIFCAFYFRGIDVRFEDGTGSMNQLNTLWIRDNKIKVIGNIYENPELLEIATAVPRNEEEKL